MGSYVKHNDIAYILRFTAEQSLEFLEKPTF